MADSSHGMVVAIAIIFSVLAILIVCLRARARSIKGPLFTIDDYLIFAATGFFIICITVPTLILAINSNLGDHMTLGPNGEPQPPTYAFNLTLRIFQTVHVVPITFAKLSILFFYRRIFRGPVFNTISWTIIALATVWGVAFLFSTLFECTPIDLSLVLPPQAPGIHCIDQTANFWGLSISDVLVDIIVLCIPFPFVWNLQMSTRHKWGVSGMFLFGILTIAASVARLVVFINAGRLLAENDPDFTYYVAPTAYIVLIEGTLAIISACLPVLRPLFAGASFESALRYMRNAFSLPSAFSRSSASAKLDQAGSSDSLSTAEKGNSRSKDRSLSEDRRLGSAGRGYVAEVRTGGQGGREGSVGKKPTGIRVQREWRTAESRAGRTL